MNIRLVTPALLCCAAVLLLIAPVARSAPPATLVSVNGKAIPQAMLEMLVVDQGLKGQPQEAEFRNYAKGQLIQREVLAQAAQGLKLDATPAYLTELRQMQQAVRKHFSKAPKAELDLRIAFNTQGMKAQGFVDDFARKNPPSDADMRGAYQQIRQAQGGAEYKVRHIQLASAEAAQAIIGKLQAGAAFETLASESTDLGSQAQGGDLGWVKTEGFPAAFAEAVQKLANGGFTLQPVQTDVGHHVIEVQGKREIPLGDFDSYKAEILERLQQQALDQAVQALMKKARVQ